MKVTALVVTYNRIELLKECIASLKAQDYPDMDILIVDNASSDGTRDYLNTLTPKVNTDVINPNLPSHPVKLLFLDQNIGGAGGFHEGIRKAVKDGAEYLWVMDDDTIPHPDACKELVNAAKILNKAHTGDGPAFSFISSNVHGMKGECMNTPRMPISQKGKNGYGDWNLYLKDSLVKVKSATFCACFFSSDAVKKVGLPIKEYFIWGDDTEYTLRLSKYYGQAYIAGKSQVLHKRLNGESLSITKEDNPGRISMFYYYVRNYLMNLRLYYGWWASIGKTLHFNLIQLQCIFKKGPHKLKKIGVIFKGIFAFWFDSKIHKAAKNRFYPSKSAS